MKTTACLFLLLALLPVVPASGQPAPVAPPSPSDSPFRRQPAQPAPADLVITGDNGSPSLSVSQFESSEAKIHLKNTSSREITVTHCGFFFPAVLTPIAPITLAPGAEAAFSFCVEGRQLFTPAPINVTFRIRDEKGTGVRSAQFAFVFKDAIICNPWSVSWRPGEPATPKTVRVTQGPAGMKVTGAKSTSPDFTVSLSGNEIAITPADVSKPHHGVILVTTEPASPRQIAIQASVFTQQPPRPLPIPPGPGNSPQQIGGAPAKTAPPVTPATGTSTGPQAK
jgi:hypothetical protein